MTGAEMYGWTRSVAEVSQFLDCFAVHFKQKNRSVAAEDETRSSLLLDFTYLGDGERQVEVALEMRENADASEDDECYVSLTLIEVRDGARVLFAEVTPHFGTKQHYFDGSDTFEVRERITWLKDNSFRKFLGKINERLADYR